ncbi:hypothetical protein N8I77_001513 [Diaporthe amygdali]|uniref:Uncharacterized protein n=1 Tax=Phomopsis amygdali TaxID=1214568 RepID=A0AAD9SP84_PHOAM|nr:hypothetical protein N8I77_001513 [Diaporthe amygdali]
MASPTVHLHLTPEADEIGEIVSLTIRIEFNSLSLQPGNILCTFGRQGVTKEESCWYPCHTPHNILTVFSDGDGPLTIYESDIGHGYLVERQTLGDVVAEWKVPLLETSDVREDRPGSVCQLFRDHGGMIGAGKYFVPRFNLGNGILIAIEWDLSNCPRGSRAVTSFGEGPERIEFTGNSDTLLECVFMAGQVRSDNQDPTSSTSATHKPCGTYWFGDLPSNFDAVTDYASKIFPRMAEHFSDQSGSYRAFLRRTSKGLRGTAFQSSSIIEYDEEAKEEFDWDLVRVLNCSMASAWARLDPEDDGTTNEWFTDGLSMLYTVYLPFRFGQRGPDYFRATVNAFLSAFYTNPLVARPPTDSRPFDTRGLSWYASSAQVFRAFVYMLKMDSFTRRAAVGRGSDLLRPMDELIRDLLSRRRKGEKIQKEHWLKGLAYWLGEDEADRNFREMLDERGKVNELDDMLSSFGAKFGPQPVEQEFLDFGFDRTSLDTGTVTGVDQGSRAWEAGLRDGDQILWYSRPEACETEFEKRMRLKVERQRENINVEYWPRSREKVVCWQVLEGKYEPK